MRSIVMKNNSLNTCGICNEQGHWIEEMDIEVFKKLNEASSKMKADFTGLCIYKYKTHNRYERLSVKAWSKLMEVKAYCVENELVSPDNRGDIKLEDVVYAFATDCAEKGDSSHLDWDSDDFYFESEHALASNDFQMAMGKLCKLLRMCFYSNSLTFHNRLEVEYAVYGLRDWVRPEVVEEYSEFCWDC